MLVAVAIYGVGTVIFALSTVMAISVACLALLGAADMVSVLIRQTLMQLSTPDDMRGRVGATTTLFVSASNELGEMESVWRHPCWARWERRCLAEWPRSWWPSPGRACFRN
jgi:hypothetical protein